MYVCMYVCMYICMYVCMYVCMCVYIYIYIHTQFQFATLYLYSNDRLMKVVNTTLYNRRRHVQCPLAMICNRSPLCSMSHP